MSIKSNRILSFILVIALMLLLAGCAHVISKEVLQDVDTSVSFVQLSKDPEAYTGKTVLLGGVIVKTVNKQEGTLLEVYQTRLDREGRPTDIDRSEGRFLGLYQDFLDSEIYKQGRQVTIAGTVQGERTQPLGEIEYRYPYLLITELHLWEEEKPVQHEPYPYPLGLWYDPWYPRGYWGFWGWSPLRYPRHYPYRR